MYLDLSERMCHGIFFTGGQPHEFGTERLIRAILCSESVFIDVGANVGYYSLLAASILTRGRVLAVEPQPGALRLLKMNAEIAAGRIDIYPYALSDSVGRAEFFVRSSGDTSSLERSDDAQRVVVEQTTLDELFSSLDRVDLVKIDVEGFEEQVLRGAKLLLQRCRPMVYFEVLEQKVEAGVVSLEAIRDLLKEQRYEMCWVNQSAQGPLMQDKPSTYALALPEEKREHLIEKVN
jgi:FkbM family methyltransferase